MSQLEVDKIIPQSGTTLTIGDSGDTITVASGATLTGDLNADNLTSGTVPSARISGAYTGITQTGTLASFASTGIDDNATSTAITIDSSENLFIGKTSTDFNAVGYEFRNNQLVVTRDAAPLMVVNRKTDEGVIIDLRKDNTGRGRIGSNSGTLYISADGNAGFKFEESSNSIVPCNKDGSDSDNDQDLGNSTNRFNDLYLGGGLYVGGTGTANKLDDYEEGEAFVGITDASGNAYSFYEQNGQYNKLVYTKIGRLVFFTIRFYTSSTSGTNGGEQARITGLPFTAINSRSAGGSFFQMSLNNMNTTNALVMGGQIVSGQTHILLQKQDTDGDYSSLTISELGAARIDITGMYHAI